jgi:hypothetical protein
MNVPKKKKTEASESTSRALTPSGFVGGRLTCSPFFLQMPRSLAEIIRTAEDDESSIPTNGSILGRLEGQDMLIGRAGSDIFIGGFDGDSFSSKAVFAQLFIKVLANELTQSPMSSRTNIGLS